MKPIYLAAIIVAAIIVAVVGFVIFPPSEKSEQATPLPVDQVLAFVLNQQFQAEGAALRVASVYNCEPTSCGVTVKQAGQEACVVVEFAVDWKLSLVSFRDLRPVECPAALQG